MMIMYNKWEQVTFSELELLYIVERVPDEECE